MSNFHRRARRQGAKKLKREKKEKERQELEKQQKKEAQARGKRRLKARVRRIPLPAVGAFLRGLSKGKGDVKFQRNDESLRAYDRNRFCLGLVAARQGEVLSKDDIYWVWCQSIELRMLKRGHKPDSLLYNFIRCYLTLGPAKNPLMSFDGLNWRPLNENSMLVYFQRQAKKHLPEHYAAIELLRENEGCIGRLWIRLGLPIK